MSDATIEPDAGRETAELAGALEPFDLWTEGAPAPDSVDRGDPQLSWRLRSPDDGRGQTAYQLRLAADPAALLDGGAIWDSGRVDSDRSIGVAYDGPDLAPCTRYWWTVRVWAGDDSPSAWAAPATFRTSLLAGGAWTTPWIAAPEDQRVAVGSGRVFYFAKEFELATEIDSAYVYATAKGIYRAHLNGRLVDVGELAPGWTTYQKRFQYQVADVAHLLERGRNRLVLAVADGWWVGNIAWWGRQLYGDHTAVSLELRIRGLDGSEHVVATGDDWEAGLGRVVDSDLLMGETQDLRLPDLELATPLGAAQVEPGPDALVVAQAHEPVAVTEVLKPVGILRRGPGTTLLDFGQHMTGRVRLRVRDGRPGDVVTVRHAEALAPDGSLYTASLRTARQEDRFVLGGGSVETLVPQFVVHGFRYAEVHGHAGRIDEADVDVEVAHSALRPAARLRSANPLLERLQQNVVWSLRANFIDIPVDCAQRDERLGWTGDINLFTPTALATADCATFLRSWLRSLADAQQPSGAVPDVAPYLNQPLPPRDINEGQPGWADAIVEMPWEIYLHTGDERVLEEAWRPVVRWLDYLVADGRLVRPVGVFGDWNTLDARTPSDLLGTVWFARAARGAAAIAHALGESEKQREYDQLYTAIRAAFQERFVAGDGSVAGETQTAYATALDAELVPAELVETAGARLVDAIASSGWHLTTGFVGTACVLHVLTALGRSDAAYRVLAQTTFPSWGFQLLNGATAMWEHWDSWRPETGFHNPKMNSFNHFAFASVGAWLYRGAAGINPDPERPGYRRIRFTPHPDTWPRELALDLDTPSGRVSSGWWTDGRTARLTLAVPPNAEGVLELPWVADARSVDVAPWSAAGEIEAAERGVRVPLGPGATVLRAPHPPRDSSDA